MNEEKEKLIENAQLKDLDLPGDIKKLSADQCRSLCKEIRSVLIKTVSKNGGHLASNLGVVELTLALHRVFDSPEDKIIWDVGHQSYTHKLLTGRYGKFSTLRQENGLSGFPKPSESEHDAFVSGHSSTSISVACGIAEAMKLEKDPHHAIAVIGDGAFTGGMAYEALNNAGKSKTNLIVVLNHNEMSISKNVGAFAKYLAGVRSNTKYVNTKTAVDQMLKKTPVVGTPISKALVASKNLIRGAVIKGNTMFEDLGFVYLGPVDGHDLYELEEVLTIARSLNKPVLVHVNTTKGKGYLPAEKNPGEYHGISKFDILTGNSEVSTSDSYSAVFGRKLRSMGEENTDICAITAAMKYGTGLQYFAETCRERFYDVGIAEQHAVTYSAALASMGKIPVFAVYSSFLQRAYDQLIHDAALSGNHVIIGVDRAGFVGEDGETHQGLYDVPMLTTIPGITIYSPACSEELEADLEKAVNEYTGVVCIRYPRGSDSTSYEKKSPDMDHCLYGDGKSDVLLVTYGRITDEVCKAADRLRKDHGISCDILKLNKIFPLEKECIETALKYKNIFFFEEGMKNGGIGSYMISRLAESGFSGRYSITAVEGFVKQASVKNQLKKYGLDSNSISEFVKNKITGADN